MYPKRTLFAIAALFAVCYLLCNAADAGAQSRVAAAIVRCAEPLALPDPARPVVTHEPVKPKPKPPLTCRKHHQHKRACWKPLVSVYFHGAHIGECLRVMKGESTYDPRADNGICGGLMQQHKTYWRARAKQAAKKYHKPWIANASVYNPEANIAVSAMLSRGGRSWAHWSVKP